MDWVELEVVLAKLTRLTKKQKGCILNSYKLRLNFMNKLAIYGGKPISSKQLFKKSPFGTEEFIAVKNVFKKGILSRAGRGHYVKLFESKFAKKFGAKYAVSTTSGTTALHTALCAVGINKGDEVLVPALTFISSASVIMQCNATPIFVDADQDTFCIDINDLKKKVTSKTKAIIIVHIYGYPIDLTKLLKFAKKRNLKIIEDCAQAHGAKYKGKPVGTLGDIGCFSFYQTKNMACGEGGMVITNNNDYYQKSCSIIDHGIVDGNLLGYNYDRVGYNYHMTEMQAAIGLEQLKKLNEINRKRNKNANLYRKLLKDTELTFQETAEGNNVHGYYVLTALLPDDYRNDRDWFVDAVRIENVEINKIYPVSLNNTLVFTKNRTRVTCKNAEAITQRLFNFYTNPGISKEYIHKTCEAVIKVLKYLDKKYENKD